MSQNYWISRRHFVGTGAAALALAAVRPSRALSRDALTPYRVIYDERFEAGRMFAREAATLGWVTRAIRGDVTNVWYQELDVRWKRGPAPIAGVTTAQSLFVLERLSWDVGMRVTARETDPETHLVRWLIRLPEKRGIGL